jgi:hypothetical protein
MLAPQAPQPRCRSARLLLVSESASLLAFLPARQKSIRETLLHLTYSKTRKQAQPEADEREDPLGVNLRRRMGVGTRFIASHGWGLTSIGFLHCRASALSRPAFLPLPTLLLLLGLLFGNCRGFLLLWRCQGLRPDLGLQDSHRKRLREKERGDQNQLSTYDATQSARGRLTHRTFASFARTMLLGQ